MPIPLVNSVASWFLKKRFHQIELFLKYPNEVQNELLLDLLETAKDTQIGKQYDFASINNYQSFIERVPISCYEDYQNLIERSREGEHNIFWPTPIKWFAKSSGTTNCGGRSGRSAAPTGRTDRTRSGPNAALRHARPAGRPGSNDPDPAGHQSGEWTGAPGAFRL